MAVMVTEYVWRGVLLPVLSGLMIAGAVKTAAAETRYVPSGSMEPTLMVGDLLVTAKFPYGYSRHSLPIGGAALPDGRLLGRAPERGDVVTFALPSDPATVFVKRVIALPGERVQYRGGRLLVNGELVARRPEATPGRFIETLPGGLEHVITERSERGPLDNTPEYLVPAGHLFVLGDNRDNSMDSRVPGEYGGVGFLPLDNLIGRVELVLASADIDKAAVRLERTFSRVH
jgi:signal peptidase I